ncbi:MAG: hypothetical protein ABIO94_05125 [Opitutaceae bacterium]
MDQEIAAWRQEVELALGSAADSLELESHLRDAIENELAKGHVPEAAFLNSLKLMGDLPALREEFVQGDDRVFASLRRRITRHKIGIHAVWAIWVGSSYIGFIGYWYPKVLERSEFRLPPFFLVFLLNNACFVVISAIGVARAARYLHSGDDRAGQFVVGFNHFMMATLSFGAVQTALRYFHFLRGVDPAVLCIVAWWIGSAIFWLRYTRRKASTIERPRRSFVRF